MPGAAAFASDPAPEPIIALVGNPNSGKTTLFNALTGQTARVGNYPGVTVDHREGRLSVDGRSVRVLDLPGTYSLVPRAEDEVVAVGGLLGQLPGSRRPDLVVCVVDATSLERNLYLTAQLRELPLPLIVVLTMMDTVEADGTTIDTALLSSRLGAPVVPVTASRREGLDALVKLFGQSLASGAPAELPALDAPVVGPDLEALGAKVATAWPVKAAPAVLGAWALSLLEARGPGLELLDAEVTRAAEAFPGRVEVVRALVPSRYARVRAWLEGVVTRSPTPTRSERLTARIDSVALHPVAGPVLLVLLFAGVFQLLFVGADPFIGFIEEAVAFTGGLVGSLVPDSMPLFRSLLVDGLVTGVGNVVVFVPQIGLLFLCLGILEDSGYLARAAFLLDRLMRRVGLHGRAFVPMLSGFACAVPAIMATRTIESWKDRLVTILVTPLVSCSARLPVYALVIATVFATQAPLFGFLNVGAVAMLSMYALTIVTALVMAAVFKRTLLKSPSPAFVLELPPYRLPRMGSLWRQVRSKLRTFLIDAGTIILAITIVLWGLFTFPRHDEAVARHAEAVAAVEGAPDAEAQVAALDAALAQDKLRYSYAGRMGRLIEPVIEPLGFDWKVGVGLVASFAAREVLVSTLGLVYGLGDGLDESSATLRDAMRADVRPDGTPIHTPLTGLSLMVFFALAMQCMSTLAAVRRETGSWKWPGFQFAYMTALAWLGAFVVFQGGRLLGLS